MPLICHLHVDGYFDALGDEGKEAENVLDDGHDPVIHAVDQNVLIR